MIDQLFEFVMNHPLLVGAFLLVLIAWIVYETRSASSNAVSSTQATQLINREDAVVLDIRESKDFKAGHIAGARHHRLDRAENVLHRLFSVARHPVSNLRCWMRRCLAGLKRVLCVAG